MAIREEPHPDVAGLVSGMCRPSARGLEWRRRWADSPSQGGAPMKFTWPYIAPWALLFASNLFMTAAWYWHLKFTAYSAPR